MSVFRANSLTAVTIFVRSTRLKPSSAAHFLAACRASTMSVSERTWRVSVFRTGIAILLLAVLEAGAEQAHPPLDVQRRPHSRQGQAQLHKGDGDRRLHAD